MITREQAVAILNPFSDGDESLTVRCRKAKPSVELLPPGESVDLNFPNQAWVDLVARKPSLKNLSIDRPSAKSMDVLSGLPLQHLSFHYPSYIKDWRFLSTLADLRHLKVNNVTSLRDLDCIARLTQLEVLILTGTYGRNLRLPSLRPIAGLTKLRVVILAAVRLDDWSLSPLHQSACLEHFSCPKACPRTELEALQVKHPQLDLIEHEDA
jgi:hypothetical protein